MVNRFFLYFLVLFGGVLLPFSCMGIASTSEVQEMDTLNDKAHAFRYINLDSLHYYAQEAIQKVNHYNLGKAESSNHLGFYFFMKMDFEEALKWHEKVYPITQNEIELLIADIGHMRIFQRTGRNKEYYDYRNSALQRMKNIEEDYTVFVEKRERLRLYYAYSEFHFISALYHFYLQQQDEAKQVLEEYEKGIKSNAFWSLGKENYKDDAQDLYYHYIKGITQLSDGDYSDQLTLSTFDKFFYTWYIARKKGYPFFMGGALQELSNLMIRPSDFEFFLRWRNSSLNELGFPITEQLPLVLSKEALSISQNYNDLYLVVKSYVTISEYLNVHSEYQSALDSLSVALQKVNQHHIHYYHKHHLTNDLDSLVTYRPTIPSNGYTEVVWIKKHILTVPEWIARIREQLSFTYAGLGNKAASDFNRNVYLDILDYTRQDKEIESRYEALKKEEKDLNITLFVTLIVALLTLLFLVWFYRRGQRRNSEYVQNLQSILELCKNITSTVLIDSKESKELATSLLKQLYSPFNEIFGVKALQLGIVYEEGEEVYHTYPMTSDLIELTKNKIKKTTYKLNLPTEDDKQMGVLELYTYQVLTKEENALISIVIPYLTWSIENSLLFLLLGEEHDLLDKERYVSEQRIAKNVKENINKKTCMAIVNGIYPYIDRIINEIQKLSDPYFFNDLNIRKGKYDYIEELASHINEYNEILSIWVQIKQGAIHLNIESFSLQDIFNVVSKGAKWFELKQQKFEVSSTESWVRADKALTLFMINTLLDNARKFTPEGGIIQLQAKENDDYVEISITDTGIGLSENDVNRIQNEKVYDAKQIGKEQQEKIEDVLQQKGSGFGLMNCKGIIEKYRKTSSQFNVCQFGVESKQGKGSRFYFRLPRGVKRLFILLCIFLSPYHSLKSQINDTIVVNTNKTNYNVILQDALEYADSVYYANIEYEYEKALYYAEVVIDLLNKHQAQYAAKPLRPIQLLSTEKPAEIDWWNSGFDTDYHTILDVRNEAAVAFMALKNWDGYQYNNEAFTRLYKMLGVDDSLSLYCRELERSQSGKVIGITLVLLFPFFIGGAYFFIHIRKRLMYRWNLEQLIEVNRCFFSSSSIPLSNGEMLQREEDTLKKIPLQITMQSFQSINELFSIDRVGLAVYNDSTKKLEYSYNPPKRELVKEIQDCFNEGEKVVYEGKYAFPLWFEVGGIRQKIGVFYIEKKEGHFLETDEVLLQLMISYLSIVVFNAIIRLANRYRDIEYAQEEKQRALWEESVLHVQNMVLDNCLSTLKHETIYYPNRIKQLVNRLQSEDFNADQERKMIADIDELVIYYKDIFSLLSRWANKQLEEITFRRKIIPVSDLMFYTKMYFNRVKKGLPNEDYISLEVRELNQSVVGDRNQLIYLMENLIDATLYNTQEGTIVFDVEEQEDFIQFSLLDQRQTRTEEELRALFYPNLNYINKNRTVRNSGVEYLLCKQIIREHDEYVGRRGCRIIDEKNRGGGDKIVFTLPKK
ncbi:MAG: DUF5113 domain-containing protein [Bacteroidales bacterium]|nr:DUF5113 domain-containing protein [Bacteroidales bacterium]